MNIMIKLNFDSEIVILVMIYSIKLVDKLNDLIKLIKQKLLLLNIVNDLKIITKDFVIYKHFHIVINFKLVIEIVNHIVKNFDYNVIELIEID